MSRVWGLADRMAGSAWVNRRSWTWEWNMNVKGLLRLNRSCTCEQDLQLSLVYPCLNGTIAHRNTIKHVFYWTQCIMLFHIPCHTMPRHIHHTINYYWYRPCRSDSSTWQSNRQSVTSLEGETTKAKMLRCERSRYQVHDCYVKVKWNDFGSLIMPLRVN